MHLCYQSNCCLTWKDNSQCQCRCQCRCQMTSFGYLYFNFGKVMTLLKVNMVVDLPGWCLNIGHMIIQIQQQSRMREGLESLERGSQSVARSQRIAAETGTALKIKILLVPVILSLRHRPLLRRSQDCLLPLTKMNQRSSHRSFSVRKGVLRNFVGPATLLKKRLWHTCLPVNFAKFFRTPFLQNTSGRLPLKLEPWNVEF